MKKIIILLIFLNSIIIPHTRPAMSNIQLGIAAYPLLEQAVEYFSIDERMTNTHQDASTEITGFIHELMEQYGVKNPHKVIIKLGKEYCSGTNILMIEWLHEKSEFSLLESLIFQYNNLDNSQESETLMMLIYQQIGSIEHEISHIKNHDCKKRILSLAAFSVATFGASKLLEYYLTEPSPYIQRLTRTADWKAKLGYNLLSGILLAKINKHIFYKICRNQERAADAMISDNAFILLAKVNLHTTIYETDKQQVERQYGTLISWLCQKIPSLYLFFDWEHPTSYERAQTFASRLVKILNQENKFNAVADI